MCIGSGNPFYFYQEGVGGAIHNTNRAGATTYTCDESGGRVSKTEGTPGGRVSKTEGTPAGQVNATTWYLFPHYELKKVGTSAAVATKYYYFGNMLIAKRTGSTLTYLHTDLLGSVLLETNSAGAVVNDQRYYAYGRRFDSGGSISGERDFTGQNKDATDLLYYNARCAVCNA